MIDASGGRKKREGAEDGQNCLYFDISKKERDSAVRYLLGAILKSRREHNVPSNYYTYDEDVNVYLAHLLFAVSLPEYQEMAEPYLSEDSSDILQWVRSTDDRTIRYFIFKVNADHILMHSAVFGDENRRGGRPLFRKSAKHYRELARLYYDQAAAYHKKIYRRRTGVGEVLEKMSKYFELYQTLLKYVRRDYFGFMNQFRDQAFHQFMSEMSRYENENRWQEQMDAFLDLYGEWLHTRRPDLADRMAEIAEELRTMDPGFRCPSELQPKNQGGPSDE